MNIDFIITWVDGNDPEWQKEKAKYSGQTTGDNRAKRYRDWEFYNTGFAELNCVRRGSIRFIL